MKIWERRGFWGFIAFVAVFLLGAVSAIAVESEFHGQFRVNYYYLTQEEEEGPNQAAARLRWRPTWDATISEDVSMHLQLNIGHITSNTANARLEQGGAPAVALRHAMLTFTTPGIGGKIAAGLVPVSDNFGDTLFSGAWDFNPLTLAYIGKVGVADIRLATAKLVEGVEVQGGPTDVERDDLDAHLADIDVPVGNGTVGASFYAVVSQDGATALGDLGDSATQYYYGVRATQEVGPIKINAFLLGNSGTIEKSTLPGLIGEDVDNTGFAGKLEGMMALGPAHVGLMVITASGDKDFGTEDSADSFITPMALIDHHGYWGYTGKLNVQGPTDTGIDDPVRIDGSHYGGDGLGFGLTTVQVKADFPIMEKLTGYVAVGIFQNNDVPDVAGSDEKTIGTDVYVQGKYNLAENLNLEAGVDWASLSKDNPIFSFTDDNTITLAFARLQLEY